MTIPVNAIPCPEPLSSSPGRTPGTYPPSVPTARASTRRPAAPVDSLIAFAGLHTGNTSYGYADWLGGLAWAVLGNVVGGLLLTTALRLVRSAPVLSDDNPAVGAGS
ncbi:hypothetical protein AB0G55_18275 [Streptomyces toyocaensis]|uniref:hypothetical protein n=1 Tax=Streptomyces toyocaensis TaxID=55952 RepID=UPI001F1958EA|nr:hypothetical protein [Streptomyces toyocaensis]